MTVRVTLKMIAKKAGVHFSTVSLALKDHTRIPVATRKRLQTLAAEMGYRPDPVLSALVAYRIRRRKPVDHGVLAWIDTWPGSDSSRKRFPTLWAGAFRRAELFGWKLEEFRLTQLGFAPDKFSRMLYTRGIEGVIIPPLTEDGDTLNLEWPRFSAVTVCHTLTFPRLHRVMPHHVHNMRMLMQNLFALGCRRPGLALERAINERTHHYWMAAFLEAQLLLPKSRRLPPLLRNSLNYDDMIKWHARHRPDVIISSRPSEAIAALETAGIRVPADVGVATPGLWPGETVPTMEGPLNAGQMPVRNLRQEPMSQREEPVGASRVITGIDERFDLIGAATIEVLVAMIHHHETGLPFSPKHNQIEGGWQPGDTVVQRSCR